MTRCWKLGWKLDRVAKKGMFQEVPFVVCIVLPIVVVLWPGCLGDHGTTLFALSLRGSDNAEGSTILQSL